MLLDLNKKFITANKEELKDKTMGELLSDLLCGSRDKKIPSIKTWQWSLKLSEKLPLELDNADFLELKRLILEANLSHFIEAQLLLAMGDFKE